MRDCHECSCGIAPPCEACVSCRVCNPCRTCDEVHGDPRGDECLRGEKGQYTVVYMRRRWWRRREVGSSAALVQGDGTVLRVDPPMVYDVLITPLVHTGRLTREACAAGGCYPRPLPEPIPCRGALGLWTPTVDVTKQLLAVTGG